MTQLERLYLQRDNALAKAQQAPDEDSRIIWLRLARAFEERTQTISLEDAQKPAPPLPYSQPTIP